MTRINVDQTINQAQDQSQEQQQAQQQGATGLPLAGHKAGHGHAQIARATNQNVVVGNSGAVVIGGTVLPPVTGASLVTTTAPDGTVTNVLTVPGVIVTIVTAPGGIPAVTVTPTTPPVAPIAAAPDTSTAPSAAAPDTAAGETPPTV